MRGGFLKAGLFAALMLLIGGIVGLTASAASVSVGLASARSVQTSSRATATAHVIGVSKKKKHKKHKKHHKKTNSTSTPILGSDFGDVALGTYQAAYDIDIPGLENTGWVDSGQYTLSSAAVAEFKLGLNTFNSEYGARCASEGTAMHITNWNCTESYQSWNGTSFGFSFSATGTDAAGTTFTETISIRYTKIS